MESKLRKHKVEMPLSLMSNAVVNVANLHEGSVYLKALMISLVYLTSVKKT